jgi:hypothetical protein
MKVCLWGVGELLEGAGAAVSFTCLITRWGGGVKDLICSICYFHSVNTLRFSISHCQLAVAEGVRTEFTQLTFRSH